MRKESARLIIEPTAARSLLSLLKTLSPIEYDFSPFDDPPATPVDLWLSYLLDTNIAPVDPPGYLPESIMSYRIYTWH